MQQQPGPDRRSVDDLSTKEIERVLAERKRQEQARRLRRLVEQGRVLMVETLAADQPKPDGKGVADKHITHRPCPLWQIACLRISTV